MSNVRRYYSFFLGIIAASVTWSVVLYFYTKLGNDSEKNVFGNTSHSIKNPKEKFVFSDKNYGFPPHENDLGFIYQKKKYYKNSDKLVKHLKAILPGVQANPSKELDSELGLVRTVEDQYKRDEGYRNFAFNVLVSDGIGLHRDLPDTRHYLCKKKKYNTDLPTASVIICFYNEHYTTLLRSVHSVLRRTPSYLLKEVILVNDFSDLAGLHHNVSNYIHSELTDKVKLFKSKKRLGLIRARIFGARKATGEVLVFLDSHIEVNVNWLQPLLSQISESRKNVVVPIIDIINADTFKYTSSPLVRGGFNWGLHFKWENLPKSTLKTDEDFVKPILTPTMAGGLFAINRAYFKELGEYDSGMNIWGGENLEISFRIWMCGGSLELIPCSRVGHVFRKRRPYGAPNGEDTMTRNSLRVANVWMDDYKEFFYKQHPDAKNVPYGDISDRLELRRDLHCHSFEWYLQNIYPELILPTDTEQKSKSKWNALEQQKFQPWHSRKRNYVAQFQLKLNNTSLCMASEKDVKYKGSLLVLRPCLRVKTQIWHLTDKNELVLGGLLCLDASDAYPKLSKCHEMGESQEWIMKTKRKTVVYNMAAGTCLGARTPSFQSLVTMELCSKENLVSWEIVQTP
ncbi:hypothetical protein RUM44_001929 [Polyplax serrata]|uniref:Polypeptide N-acetylgalactosaminyltransferase n=1 Tax=Polyplax serrata TaxID=468196 RepID=A0ABR1ALF4_POLSC